MNQNDTIVARATPIGYSSIGVVRLSGPSAISILKQIFIPKNNLKEFEPNCVYYGSIVDIKERESIDEVLVAVFKKPLSYTGEDVVEISCHGNPLIIDRIIKIFIALGARIAQRGEFTRRALINGKIDLLQAEAVQDIVFAPCEQARRIATDQLRGKLSEKIFGFKAKLIDIMTIIEANIDFSEDEPLGYDLAQIMTEIQNCISEIDMLLASSNTGLKVKEGYKLVIIGRANVGKSTLFNKLIGYDRVIVHKKPGTTRDYIEEGIELEGLYLRLFDTAGTLFSPQGPDTIAYQRTKELIKDADFILLMFDGSDYMNEQDIELYNLTKNKEKIIIVNKIDLNLRLDNNEILTDSVKLSAKTGKNVELLRQMIKHRLVSNLPKVDILLTRQRHIQALKDVRGYLTNFLHSATLDTRAFELHSALDVIGELTGKVMRKDILDRIFEEFCIGK